MNIICYASGKNEFLENSISAIENCQNTNKNWYIELDIQLTKDEIVIAFHDTNLKRITSYDKEVKDLFLSEIQKIKTAKIATLVEILTKYSKAKFVFDIKTQDRIIVEKIEKLITKFQLKNCVIVSKNDAIKQEFVKKLPQYCYAASKKEVLKLVLFSKFRIEKWLRLKSDIYMLPLYYKKKKIATKRILYFLKKHDKKVWLWIYEGKEIITVDNSNQYKRVKKLNVDGIFTSNPKKLNQELLLTTSKND